MSQTAASNYNPHFDSKTNLFLIAQTAVTHVVRPRTVTQAFTINQTATALHVKFAVASNLFVIAETASAARIFNATSTINFSQSTTVQKVILLSPHNVFAPVQVLARNIRVSLSPSNALVFQHVYQRQTMLNGVYQLTPVPELIVTKTIDRVSFRTKDRAIILRPPLLGDSEATPGKIVLQRTISGGTFVYARRTNTRVLKYTFEMDSNKTLEMRRFMFDCLSDPIWLENWKGEIWVGYFMNNPFETTTKSRAAPKGEWHSFEVEFEGERIH
jgi:hypothetical protein